MRQRRVTFLLGPLDGLEVWDLEDAPAYVLVPHPATILQGADFYALYTRSDVSGRGFYVYAESGPRGRYPKEAVVLKKESFRV